MIPTGSVALDSALGGIEDGELLAVLSPPRGGKTSLLAAFAASAARARRPILFATVVGLGLEPSPVGRPDQLLCLDSGRAARNLLQQISRLADAATFRCYGTLTNLERPPLVVLDSVSALVGTHTLPRPDLAAETFVWTMLAHLAGDGFPVVASSDYRPGYVPPGVAIRLLGERVEIVRAKVVDHLCAEFETVGTALGRWKFRRS